MRYRGDSSEKAISAGRFRLVSGFAAAFRKALCVGLAASMVFFGLSLRRGSAAPSSEGNGAFGPVGDNPGIWESRPLNLDVPTREKLYETLMKEGITLAADPEKRKEAVEAFKKAIALRPEKVREPLSTLDEKAKSVYLEALRQTGKPNLDEKKKEEKSWFAKNWFWALPLAIGVAAGFEYAFGDPLHIFTKKEETSPPPPKDVTIALDAYNSTQGLQKSLEARTVKAGTTIDIPISDLGVSGVDTKYVAVYSEDFKKKISFDTDGSATFIAPQSNIKYHIILFNKLGTNPAGQQVSYDWVIGAKLQNSKRNHKVFRKDFDGQTMEERVWGGADLPEIGGKRGVFDQLSAALNVGYTTWGSIDRQPTATSGDFSYGAGNSSGADGQHMVTWITVNAKKLDYIMSMVAVGLEEGFENLLNVDDIGGQSSSLSIQYHAVLVQNGKDLFVFAYIKDDASFTSSTTGVAVMSAAVNTINVDKKIGPVEFGLNSGMLHAGFNNDRLSARTSLRMNGSGIESRTEAAIRMNQFQAGVSMIRSPLQELYLAQGAFTIDRIILGANGGYDDKSRASSIGLSAIAPLSKGDGGRLMLGYNQSNDRNGQRQGLSVAASTRINNNSGVALSGNYSRQGGLQKAEALSIGASADLDIEKIGRLTLTASHAVNNYALQRNKSTTLDLAFQPRIPGMLYFRVVDMNGMARDYQVGYTVTLKIK